MATQQLRINSMAGGVSTNPADKRMPGEMENLDNAYLSRERGVEKRAPFVSVGGGTDLILDFDPNAYMFWIDRDGSERHLVYINPNATDKHIQIVDPIAGVLRVFIDITNPQELAYLRAGDALPKDKLRHTTIFDNTLLLNTQAPVQYKTTGSGAPFTYTYPAGDLAGEPIRVPQKIDDPNLPGRIIDDPDSQNVENWSYLQLPPDSNDNQLPNGHQNDGIGTGKVWYCREDYLDKPAGWWIARSGDQAPWYSRVRSESANSVFDEYTLPLMLTSLGPNSWTIGPAPWSPRLSGDLSNNKGPSFINGAAPISAMALWRNRLWLASGNTIVSSRANDLFDLWIDNVNSIVDEDPIDVVAVSSEVSTVTWMTPINDFLQINTTGKVQFELAGSQNFISPTTAELSPTSFYGALPQARPVLMGNALFFPDTQRLYAYMPTMGANINPANDVSFHVRGYLPSNVRITAVAESENQVMMVNEDAKNEIYCYTSRFEGNQQTLSAFHRWVLDSGSSVHAMRVFDDDVYILNSHSGVPYIEKAQTGRPNDTLPLIDRLVSVQGTYSPATEETTFEIPWDEHPADYAVKSEQWTDSAGTPLSPEVIGSTWSAGQVIVPGNFSEYPIYFGLKYNFKAELPKLFLRDGNNNVVFGSLNLKNAAVRYANTGDFKVLVGTFNREPTEQIFAATNIGDADAQLGTRLVEELGEFHFPIGGEALDTTISFESDFAQPVNLTQLDITADFGQSKRSPTRG